MLTTLNRRRRRRVALGVGVCMVGLLGLVPWPVVAAAPHREGESVEVTGLVTDPEGLPVAGIRVVLERTRRKFDLRKFRRVEKDSVRLATDTNDQGEYSLRWPWNPYFTHFVLVAGLPIPDGAGRVRFEEFYRIDLTERVRQGSPVVAPIALEDTRLLRELRDLEASIRSDDQRTVFRELGKPEKVETVEYPNYREVSWWYFEDGRVYRFRDGKIAQVVHFDPVEPF